MIQCFQINLTEAKPPRPTPHHTEVRERAYKKATIKDVAAAASVSITTVSHVVSGVPGYSAETVRKVRAAIQQLNYVPSYVARGLRQRATNTIGVCSDDPYDRSDGPGGTFSRQFWRGILDEADRLDQSILHFPRAVRNGTHPEPFLNGQIDGVIMTANHLDNRPRLVAQAGLPVVIVARSYDIPDQAGLVKVSERSIVELGMNFLWELGHRRIAHLTGPHQDIYENGELRVTADDVAVARLEHYEGFMRLREAWNPHLLFNGTREWGVQVLPDEFIPWFRINRPTALFCANDLIADAARRSLAALGIDVPGEVSILGIDDDPVGIMREPHLTTIRVPVEEVGAASVRAVLAIGAGQSAASQRYEIDATELVVRASTGPMSSVLHRNESSKIRGIQ